MHFQYRECQNCSLKIRQEGLNLQKREYENLEKKQQTVIMRHDDSKEPVKQYEKKNIWKIEH